MHSRVGHWLGAVMNMSVCTFMTKRTGLSTLRPSATKGRALFSGDLNPLICVMKYWYYTALVCWDKNITHKDSKKWDKLVKTASSARSQLGETGLCACCAGELYKDHVAGHPQQPQTPPPPPRNTGQAEKHTKQTSPVPVLQNWAVKIIALTGMIHTYLSIYVSIVTSQAIFPIFLHAAIAWVATSWDVDTTGKALKIFFFLSMLFLLSHHPGIRLIEILISESWKRAHTVSQHLLLS